MGIDQRRLGQFKALVILFSLLFRLESDLLPDRLGQILQNAIMLKKQFFNLIEVCFDSCEAFCRAIIAYCMTFVRFVQLRQKRRLGLY